MASFHSTVTRSVSFRALPGQAARLIQATCRRFVVAGALLWEQVEAMRRIDQQIDGRVDLATVVWGMDETYQWISQPAVDANTALGEFMKHAEEPVG